MCEYWQFDTAYAIFLEGVVFETWNICLDFGMIWIESFLKLYVANLLSHTTISLTGSYLRSVVPKVRPTTGCRVAHDVQKTKQMM